MGLELKTSRLRLEPCRIEHIQRTHALWTNERVRRFLFDDRLISLAEAHSFIEASLANFKRYGYGLWLILARDSDQLVGFAGLLRSDEEAPNLIYGIHPDFAGRGYATEAAGRVLSYALESLALSKVKADVDEPNVESVRVLEKLKMERVNRVVVGGRPLLYFERLGLGERVEWDVVWRSRPLRQLVSPVQIDVAPIPNHTFGEVTHVDIAADPPQFADSGWRRDDLCPVCGNTTLVESRIAVTIYPYFATGFSYGICAWAHRSCLAACKEIAGPAPIPW
jgi:[ribosomal protein S5]-alanine N-acetyltransferase